MEMPTSSHRKKHARPVAREARPAASNADSFGPLGTKKGMPEASLFSFAQKTVSVDEPGVACQGLTLVRVVLPCAGVRALFLDAFKAVVWALLPVFGRFQFTVGAGLVLFHDDLLRIDDVASVDTGASTFQSLQ